MAHDIFISHSSKDKTVADAVCATLEANGIRCWIAPRDVAPGANWGAAIVEAIQQSRVMVLVFSDHANASGQIAREVECAASHAVTIVPIRVQDVLPARSLQFFLANIHWIDALSPPLERRLQEIAAKIKVMLKHEDTAAIALPPNQKDSPSLASRKFILWAGLALVAVLLGAGVMLWRPWAGKNTSTNPTALAGTALVSQTPSAASTPAPLDPALVGRWSCLTTLLNIEVLTELSLDAAGRYKFRKSTEANGTVELKDGEGKATDTKNGMVTRTKYSFPSDDRLTWIVPNFMTVLYKRTGGKRVAENPIVGKWEGNTFFLGLNWDVTWEVQPDLSFHVLFENEDEGNFTAAGGEWETKSRLGRPDGKGIYRNVTPDSFEMSDQGLQKLKFERVRSAR